MIDRGVVKRLKGLTLGMGRLSRWALLVFFSLFLLSGQVSAADEGTIEVGIIPNPLAVSVFAPGEVIKGEHFTVSTRIENLGDGKIEKTVAAIHLDGKGLSLGKQKAEKRIGKLQPHEVITVDWRVKAVEAGYYYIVLVSVSGRGIAGDLTAQDSVVVTVKERRGGFFSFFQGWYQVFTGG